MKRLIYTLFIMSLMSLILVACDNLVSVIAPPPTATPSPTPIPPTPTPLWFDERPPHFSTVDDSLETGYAYRAFLQTPLGVAWGPDGNLYIADWGGQHIVKVSKFGSMEDLGIWKDVDALQQDGPRSVAFDFQGLLYFNNQFGIFRMASDGTVDQLPGIEKQTLGSIVFSSDDTLYYTDSSEDGGVYQWNPDGSSTIVAEIPFAENLVFGLDDKLYVSRTKSCAKKDSGGQYSCHASLAAAKQRTSIKQVDVTNGRVRDFYYPTANFFSDSIFLAVDSEGNIWLRGNDYIKQLSSTGSDKSYSIYDNIIKEGHRFIYHSAGGIAFDDDGALWVASDNSSLWQLIRITEEKAQALGITLTETTFIRPLITPGIKATDLAVGPSGDVFAMNENAGELWRIPPSGNPKVLSTYQVDYWKEGWASVAVDDQEQVFLGAPHGVILQIDENGSKTSYADLFTRKMVFGIDDLLYAVGGDVESFKEIVHIDESGKVTTLAIDVEGNSLGKGEVHIALATDEGFYVFLENNSTLYFLDYEDNSYSIADLASITGGGPIVMTSSPKTGDIFLIPKENTTLFQIDRDGNSRVFAEGFIGDVSGLAVSPDGKWLYIAEAGAIGRITLSNP